MLHSLLEGSRLGHLYGPFPLGSLYALPGCDCAWYFVPTHNPGATSPLADTSEDSTAFCSTEFPHNDVDTGAAITPQAPPPDSWDHYVCGEFEAEYIEEVKP